MGKAYTSAANRARITDVPASPDSILEWVGQDIDRARAALGAVRAWTLPADITEEKRAEHAQLVAALEQVLPWFDLDGIRFIARGNAKMLDLCEFARAADLEAASAAGMAALAEFYEALLGRAEYQRFRKHCRTEDTDDDVLIQIMQDLIEEFTSRPTRRSSASAGGPQTTSPTSKVVSLSSGSVQDAPMTVAQFDAWVSARRQELGSSDPISAPG